MTSCCHALKPRQRQVSTSNHGYSKSYWACTPTPHMSPTTQHLHIGRLQPNRGHTARRTALVTREDPCPSPAPRACAPQASHRAPPPPPPAPPAERAAAWRSQWLTTASQTCANTVGESGAELSRVPGALVPLVATTRGPGAAWRPWTRRGHEAQGAGYHSVPVSAGLSMHGHSASPVSPKQSTQT